MPFDEIAKAWYSHQPPLADTCTAQDITVTLAENLIDYITEQCWDTLDFEDVEAACQGPSNRTLCRLLAFYYSHLIENELCSRCGCPFRESTFLKLIGVPSFQKSKHNKVFLVHKFIQPDENLTEKICYPFAQKEYPWTEPKTHKKSRNKFKSKIPISVSRLDNRKKGSGKPTKDTNFPSEHQSRTFSYITNNMVERIDLQRGSMDVAKKHKHKLYPIEETIPRTPAACSTVSDTVSRQTKEVKSSKRHQKRDVGRQDTGRMYRSLPPVGESRIPRPVKSDNPCHWNLSQPTEAVTQKKHPSAKSSAFTRKNNLRNSTSAKVKPKTHTPKHRRQISHHHGSRPNAVNYKHHVRCFPDWLVAEYWLQLLIARQKHHRISLETDRDKSNTKGAYNTPKSADIRQKPHRISLGIDRDEINTKGTHNTQKSADIRQRPHRISLETDRDNINTTGTRNTPESADTFDGNRTQASRDTANHLCESKTLKSKIPRRTEASRQTCTSGVHTTPPRSTEAPRQTCTSGVHSTPSRASSSVLTRPKKTSSGCFSDDISTEMLIQRYTHMCLKSCQNVMDDIPTAAQSDQCCRMRIQDSLASDSPSEAFRKSLHGKSLRRERAVCVAPKIASVSPYLVVLGDCTDDRTRSRSAKLTRDAANKGSDILSLVNMDPENITGMGDIESRYTDGTGQTSNLNSTTSTSHIRKTKGTTPTNRHTSPEYGLPSEQQILELLKSDNFAINPWQYLPNARGDKRPSPHSRRSHVHAPSGPPDKKTTDMVEIHDHRTYSNISPRRMTIDVQPKPSPERWSLKSRVTPDVSVTRPIYRKGSVRVEDHSEEADSESAFSLTSISHKIQGLLTMRFWTKPEDTPVV